MLLEIFPQEAKQSETLQGVEEETKGKDQRNNSFQKPLGKTDLALPAEQGGSRISAPLELPKPLKGAQRFLGPNLLHPSQLTQRLALQGDYRVTLILRFQQPAM